MTTTEEQLNKFKNFYTDYCDGKDSDHYLIHFKPSSITNELKIYLTNGLNQWYFSLNDKSFQTTTTAKKLKFSDFLEDFHDILSKKRFSLNKIYNKDTNKDLVKFELNNSDNCYYFQLNDVYEPIEHLTSLVFSLFDKCTKLENDLAVSREASSQQSQQKREQTSRDGFRKGICMAAHTQRKPGMSIINPHSRKRKVPKGVQFGDKDGASSSNDSDSD